MNTSAILFTILALCLGVHGQTVQRGDCPLLNVDHNIRGFFSEVPYSFWVLDADKLAQYSPTYRWHVDNGQVIGGQSTSRIVLSWTDQRQGITASVEIGGLPQGCANRAGASVTMDLAPEPTKLDEIKTPLSKIPPRRYEAILRNLNASPDAMLFIFLPRTGTSSRDNRRILDKNLTSKIDQGKLRVKLVDSRRDGYIEVWLVPPGASAPKP